MDTNIGMAQGVRNTPASTMRDYMVQNITSLMVIGGIESISVVKYDAGFGSRLHVTISPFSDAPREIVSQGIIIKDAIAQVMSISNITRISISLSTDEMAGTLKMWKKSVDDAADKVKEKPAQAEPGQAAEEELPEPPEGGVDLDMGAPAPAAPAEGQP